MFHEVRTRHHMRAMSTRVAAAVIEIFLAATSPLPALSQDEKSPNECRKYLTAMSEVLDTLEALVPNVLPDEASYLEKENAAAIQSGAGKRIVDVEHSQLLPGMASTQ